MNYKNFCKLLWLFCVCIFSKEISAQQQENSLPGLFNNSFHDSVKVRLLLDQSGLIYKTNMDSALIYSNEALVIAKKNDLEPYVGKSYRYLGNAYLRHNYYEKALENYNKSLLTYEDIGDKDAISYLYISMGLLHLNIGNLNKALEYDELALDISKQTGNMKNIGLAYGNIGAALGNFNKAEEAREYYIKALAIFREIGNKKYQKWMLGNIGAGYFKLNDYERALEYFREALDILEKNPSIQEKGFIFRNIGEVYRVNNEFDSALIYYNKALKDHIDRDRKNAIADDYLCLGAIFEQNEKNDLAIYYYEKSLNLANEIQYKITQKDASERLFEHYLTKRSCSNFEKYFSIYREISESIFNEDNNRKMIEAKVKFDLEKNEQEILQLRHEKRITKVKFFALMTILFLSLIIVILLYTKQKNKIVQNRKIQKAEKNLLELELKNSEFEKNSLKEKLKFKNEELINLALHIIQNIEFIEITKEKISKFRKNLKQAENLSSIKEIENFMIRKLSVEKERKEFQLKIELINQEFFYKLEKEYPELNDSEKKLAALLRLNFSSKEIASLFNISIKSVEMKRYRLRQKLGVEKDKNTLNFLNKF